MRHRNKFKQLSRKSEHRNAMLGNMAVSLILHKRITTTTAKAKALRTFVEPIITRSKEDSTHSRRMVYKDLQNKAAVGELFHEVASKVADRPGGYTRIIKVDNRLGDNADLCIIELVDFNENLLTEKKAAAKPKTARRRRGTKKKEDTGDVAGAHDVAAPGEATAVEVEESEASAEGADLQDVEEATPEIEETNDVQDSGETEDEEKQQEEPKS
jgi:large subunit ribosomal protein L17